MLDLTQKYLCCGWFRKDEFSKRWTHVVVEPYSKIWLKNPLCTYYFVLPGHLTVRGKHLESLILRLYRRSIFKQISSLERMNSNLHIFAFWLIHARRRYARELLVESYRFSKLGLSLERLNRLIPTFDTGLDLCFKCLSLCDLFFVLFCIKKSLRFIQFSRAYVV